MALFSGADKKNNKQTMNNSCQQASICWHTGEFEPIEKFQSMSGADLPVNNYMSNGRSPHWNAATEGIAYMRMNILWVADI